MSKTARFSVTATILLASAGTDAHHSFSAIFDADQPVEVTGTVTRIDWMNPHVWFYLDAENADGEVESWAFEMGSPNRLQRYGWHQGSMLPGQTITVVASRARDGSLKAAIERVILPGGKELFGAQEAAQ
jgi:Family of unknown function (DUF6152)